MKYMNACVPVRSNIIQCSLAFTHSDKRKYMHVVELHHVATKAPSPSPSRHPYFSP